MAINYSWEIKGLRKAPSLNSLTDVVTSVEFAYVGTDEDSGIFAKYHGSLDLPSPDSENFTDLSSLTESIVTGWVSDLHPIDYMQDYIQSEIQSQVTPTNVPVEGLPWVEDPELNDGTD